MKVYWQQEDNWGDKLTPYIIEKITGKKPEFSDGEGKILLIGSILTHARKGDVVFGSGLLDKNHLPKSLDILVESCRGLLTKGVLESRGIKVKKVLGDPAIILPLLYKPKVNKQYEKGMVLHYVDRGYDGWARGQGYHVIYHDTGIEDYIDEVNKCGAIYSSSLHGLICAEAYGIPAQSITLSGNTIGNLFKFADYYSQTFRTLPQGLGDPVDLGAEKLLKELKEFLRNYL